MIKEHLPRLGIGLVVLIVASAVIACVPAATPFPTQLAPAAGNQAGQPSKPATPAPTQAVTPPTAAPIATTAPVAAAASSASSAAPGGMTYEIVDVNAGLIGKTLYILGGVKNTGTTPIGFLRLPVDAKDAQGKVVASTQGVLFMDIVPPGQTGSFSARFDQAPAGWKTFDIHVVPGKYDNLLAEYYSDMTVIQPTGTLDANNGVIPFEVKNTGTRTTNFAFVVITIRDAQRKIVGADEYHYTTLAAGETVSGQYKASGLLPATGQLTYDILVSARAPR